jgi:hypothetical protein
VGNGAKAGPSVFFFCLSQLEPLSTLGFGAAILWVAVGSYITKSSLASDYGRNNGIFWGIFQVSNVLGNLGAYFVFKVGSAMHRTGREAGAAFAHATSFNSRFQRSTSAAGRRSSPPSLALALLA